MTLLAGVSLQNFMMPDSNTYTLLSRYLLNMLRCLSETCKENDLEDLYVTAAYKIIFIGFDVSQIFQMQILILPFFVVTD